MRFAPPPPAALAVALALTAPAASAARQTPAVEVSRRTAAPAPMDANATRLALMDLLQRHPPSVGRVLKLDPALMENDAYLAAYPELREFLAAHPEIGQNASYYLEHVRFADQNGPPPSQQIRLVEQTLGGLAALTVMTVVVGTLIWLIRTVVDQRRWTRLSKIQAEVHTKLLDRFASNEDLLLAYAQMPAGRRFLESGPSPLEEAPHAIGAPLSRILWSVQLGAVLLVSGLALILLSSRSAPDIRQFFFIFGCMATALGAGFAVSAAAAYALSKRMGLLDRPVHGNA